MAIQALRMESNWSVASFEGAQVGEYHGTPWHFRSIGPNHDHGTVEAEGYWIANWHEIGQERIHCEMTSGGLDSWDLVFVNNKWFVGYKQEDLYRLGERL
jgi:hypothetical protein